MNGSIITTAAVIICGAVALFNLSNLISKEPRSLVAESLVEHAMDCEIVARPDFLPEVSRCVNDEVICYSTGHNGGISCKEIKGESK